MAGRGRKLVLDPALAGVGVGVIERFGQQCVARVEVVVDERGRDPRVDGDPGDPHRVDSLAGDPTHRGGEDSFARASPAAARVHWTESTGARSARTRSANQDTAASRIESGPHT